MLGPFRMTAAEVAVVVERMAPAAWMIVVAFVAGAGVAEELQTKKVAAAVVGTVEVWSSGFAPEFETLERHFPSSRPSCCSCCSEHWDRRHVVRHRLWASLWTTSYPGAWQARTPRKLSLAWSLQRRPLSQEQRRHGPWSEGQEPPPPSRSCCCCCCCYLTS